MEVSYQRSLKNVVKLENYYMPWEIDRAIARFVEHYNHRWYHETLDNVTPADVYFGRRQEILSHRERIKRETLAQRKRGNLRAAYRAALQLEVLALRQNSLRFSTTVAPNGHTHGLATASSGLAYRNCGPAGEIRSSSSSLTPSLAGPAKASGSSGPGGPAAAQSIAPL